MDVLMGNNRAVFVYCCHAVILLFQRKKSNFTLSQKRLDCFLIVKVKVCLVQVSSGCLVCVRSAHVLLNLERWHLTLLQAEVSSLSHK